MMAVREDIAVDIKDSKAMYVLICHRFQASRITLNQKKMSSIIAEFQNSPLT